MPDTTPSERSSLLSPNATGPNPSWGPPRAPLAPHRLAKLANALGVSTPVPISHSHSLPSFSPSSQPSTSASSSFSDPFRRSPTPSAASVATHTSTASSSKYLLHVIPPEHLPHDMSDEHELTPLPATASGYHSQFRRGIMVPVYPSLHSQLSAIAREYALPSTFGMVLYLITTTSTPSSDSAVSEEPGPRISEEIWKHIWTRILRAEQQEALSPGPRPLGLGFSTVGQSSPALLQEVAANANSLRSLISPKQFDSSQPPVSQPTPSPSTPSNSAYSSQSELDTPESASSVSVSGDTDANSIPLRGLTSPSLIPILAKVEFDIDRRKAGWYEPWVRSRRVNQAKRAESRLGARSRMGTVSDADEGTADEESTKKAPIDLKLTKRIQSGSPIPKFLLTADASADGGQSDNDEQDGDALSAGYQELTESPVQLAQSEESEVEEMVNGHDDPLADVFGADDETWADLHAESETRRISMRQANPNVVELALNGAALSATDDLEDDYDGDNYTDVGEVTELLNAINRPTLSVSIPPSPTGNASENTTAATIKRHVPPPLDLSASGPNVVELAVPASSPMPDSSGSSVKLAYLREQMSPMGSVLSQPQHSDNDEELEDVAKERSPLEEKREGAIFDDLNLGLDPSIVDDGSEYDESDPNDRRKSQYIMAAQLDEIEKNLAQLSPRQLKPEILADESPIRSAGSRRSNSNGGPRSSSKSSGVPPGETPSWPAVPYSALNSNDDDDDPDRPPSPPRFAFNGISTEPPKVFQPKRPRDTVMSNESLARKRALEEEQGLYPPLAAPNIFLRDRTSQDSPIIPLSPDPFGRFPSQAESIYMEDQQRDSQLFQDSTIAQPQEPVIQPPDRTSSLTLGQSRTSSDRSTNQTPSSRFSFDSVTSEETNRLSTSQQKAGSLMSVKSIRRLWRKSGKNESISSTPSTPPIPESGRVSPNMPPPNIQNAQHTRSRSKSLSKQMFPPQPPPKPSDNLPVPPVIQTRRESPYQRIQLDGDSRYPVHPISRGPSPAEPAHQRPPSVSQQSSTESNRNSGVRKSILKSWKSASGSLSVSSLKNQGSSRPTSSTTTPRSSVEQPPSEAPVRRRRPSILELAASSMRSSVAGSSAGLSDIPPSPALPEQYANLPHSRASSRQSQMTLNSYTNGAARPDSRRGPSVSSLSAMASSPPRGRRSPLTINTSSPPKNGNNAVRHSDASWDERPSFDVSEFEIVTPPKPNSHFFESTFSYPYNGLDHSLTSSNG